MKTKRLTQIVVSYSERDGIGSIITGLHQVAHKKGIQSHIIFLVGKAETADPKLTKLSAFVDDRLDSASKFETQFVCHFGFSNELMENFILSRIPKSKCFYYHNVTPADFFALWDPPLARQLLKTRSNMIRLLHSPWKITGDFILISDQIHLNAAASGASNYNWEPDYNLCNPNISNPLAGPDVTVTYTVSVSNSFGCVAIDTGHVEVYDTVIAMAGADTTICPGGSVQLNGSGGINFQWAPPNG